MASAIILFGVLLSIIATSGYYYVSSELLTARELVRESDVDLELDSYVSVYQGFLRNLLATERINSTEMAAALRCQLESNCATYELFGNSSNLPPWVRTLTSPYSIGNTRSDVRAQVVSVSPVQSPQQYVTVRFFRNARASELSPDRLVSFQLGQVAVFKNALTGNSFKCIFCHAKVMGDVASYMPIMINDPRSSQFHGRFITGSGVTQEDDSLIINKLPTGNSNFVLSDYPHSNTDEFDEHYVGRRSINNSPNEYRTGNGWTTDRNTTSNSFYVFDVVTNYMGPGLPWNYVRKKMMLPKFDPDVMAQFARGTLNASMAKVPLGALYAPAAHQFSPTKVINNVGSHVILDGRRTPIVINGQVFIRGDVIILGRVSGKGEIYSGRNIYIPDDLTYLNPPPHFNGMEANNRIMHLVSLQPGPIAAAMKNYDRLGLFATNNIIIGSPYSATPGQLDADNVFINGASLMKYSAARELAYEPGTGHMYDREIIDENTVCYLKPWQTTDDCIVMNGSYPDRTARVVVTPIMDRYAKPQPTIRDDRYHYMNWERPMRPNPHYLINILPNSFVGNSVKPWITEAHYHQLADSSDKRGLLTDDAYGRKKRVFEGSLALPSSNPYSANAINTNAIINLLETQYGAISALDTAKSNLGDAGAPAGGYVISNVFKRFLRECERAAKGDGTPRYPITGMIARDRTNYRTLSNKVIKVQGLTARDEKPESPYFGDPLHHHGIICQFNYSPQRRFPDGSRGEVSGRILYLGRALASTSFNDDTRKVTFCRTWTTNPPSTGGYTNPFPPCLTKADGSPLPMVDENGYDQAEADGSFTVNVRFGPEGHYFVVQYTGRYYDPAKVNYRNRVDKIQALLFANQFVSYSHYSGYDRQLRLHGGVVSKDLLGRFVNSVGPETRRVKNNYLSNDYEQTSHGSGSMGLFPSLWVILDPRFQFTTEVIGNDLLSVSNVD